MDPNEKKEDSTVDSSTAANTSETPATDSVAKEETSDNQSEASAEETKEEEGGK